MAANLIRLPTHFVRALVRSTRGMRATILFAALLCSSACADSARKQSTANSDSSAVTDKLPQFSSITAGRQFTCALDTQGTAWCWGSNRHAQLGLGDTLDRFLPTRLQHSVPFVRLAAGRTHVCAEDNAGSLHCWGDNREFALADTAVRVQGRPRTLAVRSVRDIAAGSHFTCVLDRAGRARCWGTDEIGQRGDGNGPSAASAQGTAVRTSVTFKALAAGSRHACGLTQAGAAWCWGSAGALGDGELANRYAPVEVSGEHVFESIAAGESITCGVDAEGASWCWGVDFDGQLGGGSPPRVNTLEPLPIAGSVRFTSLAPGHRRVCGLDNSGAAWCWGSNYLGGLGSDSDSLSATPVRVAGTATFVALASGDLHSCAIDTHGAVWCWGANADSSGGGALGDGTVRSRSVPTRVAAPSPR